MSKQTACMALRSDLVDALEVAITDEAYDGYAGPMSEGQYSRMVRKIAEVASEVVEHKVRVSAGVGRLYLECTCEGLCVEMKDGVEYRPIFDRHVTGAAEALMDGEPEGAPTDD